MVRRSIILVALLTSSASAATVIIVEHTDGQMTFIRPLRGPRPDERNEAEFLEGVRLETWPGLRNTSTWTTADDSVLPRGDYWRPAWEWNRRAGEVRIDRAKAEAHQRSEIRRAAVAERAKLYLKLQEATALGDTVEATRIATKLQAIKDAAVDGVDLSTTTAPTLDELQARWLEGLPR